MSDSEPPVNPYDQSDSSDPSTSGYYPAFPGEPGRVAPDHPQATTSLVLGVLGLVLCGVLAPFAWVMGGRAVREIDESAGALGGRGTANVGRILGIVGSVLLLFSVGFVVLALVGLFASTTTGY